MVRFDGTYGRIPEIFTAFSNEVKKVSFTSLENPIVRERLTCNGRGTPRSLVKNVWMSNLLNDTTFEIRVDKRPDSIVEGYPRMN